MTDHMHHDSSERRNESRQMIDRLESLERDHQSLVKQVTVLDSKLNMVQLEQGHIKELLDARLRTLEKTIEVLLSEIKSLCLRVEQMAGNPEGTPMGRIITTEVNEVKSTVNGHGATLLILKDWQTRVDGILLIMKWVGAGGLVALGIQVLRFFKILP